MASRSSRCPMCAHDVPEGAAASPFCSDRCRLLDLGNWLDERYVLPATVDDDGSTPDDSEDPTGRLQ